MFGHHRCPSGAATADHVDEAKGISPFRTNASSRTSSENKAVIAHPPYLFEVHSVLNRVSNNLPSRGFLFWESMWRESSRIWRLKCWIREEPKIELAAGSCDTILLGAEIMLFQSLARIMPRRGTRSRTGGVSGGKIFPANLAVA